MSASSVSFGPSWLRRGHGLVRDGLEEGGVGFRHLEPDLPAIVELPPQACGGLMVEKTVKAARCQIRSGFGGVLAVAVVELEVRPRRQRLLECETDGDDV